jgi:hypothetical protein
MNYAEFLMSPKGLTLTTESHWECRNLGLLKIMARVMENLLSGGLLKDQYTVRINTADGPTKDKRPGVANFLEFDTGADNRSNKDLFPDYVFGNWWHIGLTDFDKFTSEVCERNDRSSIVDGRIFWIGNLQGIWQRVRYAEMARANPEKMIGEVMSWTNNGSRPTKFVSTKDYCDYKYLIDLTGHACSGRLKILPFCNRPLFIADRKFWSWSDILILEQGLHIPVANDLGDLLERYDWAERNEEEAFSNSSALLEFCREGLTYDKACEQATRLVAAAMDEVGRKTSSRAGKKMKFDVVVAHYKENLSWVERLAHDDINNIFIYTKGDKEPVLKNPKVRIVRLPNVGRESHTYLSHCVSQYEQMKAGSSNFVFFLQGDPHGMNEVRVPEWMECVSSGGLKYTYNFRISSPFDFLNKGRCQSWAGATDPASCDVKEWCERFIKKDCEFSGVPIFWNACFGVSTERILSNPSEKYKKIIDDELNTINPECGHYCERLWYYMFNMDEVKLDVGVQDCYDFWGGVGGLKHYGMMRLNKDGSVGFYSHPNESYWRSEGDSIVLMDRTKKPTSVLKRSEKDHWVGSFLGDPKTVHRLTPVGDPSSRPR